ncbi:hypothetical protein [Clostridium cylindrosporum]|uniref:Uncharacterized protein n=1 Tax=Clostridium cylindrosporum DSM 605 TaxID=1121307 RepID=A0A0J8DAY8_CLOCY|nr:hypothetical protein [Clostridium cylindrosporum]KMT23225.1 hypothetical protein CLCY_6c01060 [Clostridium cylindrosporum DSM 605]
MNREELINKNKIEELTPEKLCEMLYNKELNCKKNILEYIDIVKILKKEDINQEKIQDTYNYIYKHIDDLKGSIKPNTILHLKNNLKSQLGKYVKEKDPEKTNHFIEFFKQAYPENLRRKDFTWVLMDLDRISDEQIWNTLIYINRECLNNDLNLDSQQKKDIINMIKKLVDKNNIKFINNVKSLEKLINILDIAIVKVGEIYKIKFNN